MAPAAAAAAQHGRRRRRVTTTLTRLQSWSWSLPIKPCASDQMVSIPQIPQDTLHRLHLFPSLTSFDLQRATPAAFFYRLGFVSPSLSLRVVAG
jgi:hypothetical protein